MGPNGASKLHWLNSFITLLLSVFFPGLLFAASLGISPDVDPIYFGEVYAYEKDYLGQCKFAFTLTPSSGECEITITPDPDYTAPPRAQQIFYNSPLSEPTPILVCISSQQPGDHDFHFLVASSNCGDLRRTLRFTCIDFARIEGIVRDFFTKQPIPDASIETLSYYLTITMIGNGSYSGVGRPGPQWVRARADNYREQTINVDITDGAILTKDFEMVPIVTLADVIGALQVLSGLGIPPAPSYLVDMNGDGRIGLEETILLLQLVSGLR